MDEIFFDAQVFFDFEEFQARNFDPIGTIDGVRFSPNALALVSVDNGGEGLFNATTISYPETTVVSYAEAISGEEELVTGDHFTIDITSLAPMGIGGGNFSFQYTSPNQQHEVEIFDSEGNSLGGKGVLFPTPGATFNQFRPFSTSLPPNTAIIAIGSRATELGIDHLRISVFSTLIANPLITSTPELILGTEADDFLEATNRLIIPLPEDSIIGGNAITNINNIDNGNATILPGGTGVEFIPLTTFNGFGSFDFTVRDRNNQFATSIATVNIQTITAIEGLGGNDTLIGNQSSQTLDGGIGNDSILGQGGNNILLGGDGDDSLFGGKGNDFLIGGAGDDWIVGGSGVNTLIGGPGNDSLVYLSLDNLDNRVTQPDRILDFNSNSDRLVFNSQSIDQGGFGLFTLNSNTQTLNPQQFITDTASLPEDINIPILIYNTLTGVLQYDIDGLGTTPEIAIAQLQSEDGDIPNLSADQIFLVNPVVLTLPENGTVTDTTEVIARDNLTATSSEIDGTQGDDSIFATAPEPFNTIEIPVLANDSPDTGLFISSINNIIGGSLVLDNGNTIVRFTPTLPGGTQASFIYTASDGTNVDTANVFIDILPVTRINGLGGDDVIYGGSGPDLLYGGQGNDCLFGETGDDILVGGGGEDTLFGDDGNDLLYGGSGPDLLYGGQGNDCLFGETGDDILVGGSGEDTLLGGGDNDVLYGGSGPDLLYGGQGDDFLLGDSGDDTLFGNAGNDTLLGGVGNDVFAYISRSQVTTGTDLILDFEPGSDRLLFNRNSIVEDGFSFAQIGTTPENSLNPQQFIILETGTYQDNLSSLDSPVLAYELSTGNLIYDPDGLGNQPSAIIANLQGNPLISVDDIQLIGIAADDTIVPELPENLRTVTTFAVISGTPGDDVITADDTINSVAMAVTIPASEDDRIAVINTITDLVRGDVNILEGGTAVQFIPTLTGGNTGGFRYNATDSRGNLISVPVTVNILTAIDGLAGDDSLMGGTGDDSLFGNVGNDCLMGGTGDDTLVGGEGNDTFAYISRDQISSGVDLIVDFTPGSDRLLFNRDEFRFTQIGTTPENSLSSQQFILVETGEFNPDNLGTINSPILAYELETGTLKYDPDGAAIEPVEIVANFVNNPPISIDDILLTGTATDTIPASDSLMANPDFATTPSIIQGTIENDTILADNPSPFNSIEIAVLDNDSPGDSITIDSLSNLEGGEATILTGNTLVEFIPTVPGGNTGQFIYRVQDSLGNTASALVTVDIAPVTVIDGDQGDDILIGSDGDDCLIGGAGNDCLIGGNGDDTLVGGIGANTLIGGEGNDIFLYASVTEVEISEGDLIIDFVKGRDTFKFTDEFLLSDPLFIITEVTDEDNPSLESRSAIIYEQQTGLLKYKNDGSGSEEISTIARLSPDQNGDFPNVLEVARDDSSIMIF